jgi:hypothetical protein
VDVATGIATDLATRASWGTGATPLAVLCGGSVPTVKRRRQVFVWNVG